MPQRIYISKLTGDGLTFKTAFRPAFVDIIGEVPQLSGAIDSVKRKLWIGTINTTASQHSLLVADSRIKTIPRNLMNRRINELTANQRTAIMSIFAYARLRTDIFSNTAKVKDILIYLVGRICWNPIKIAVEEIG